MTTEEFQKIKPGDILLMSSVLHSKFSDSIATITSYDSEIISILIEQTLDTERTIVGRNFDCLINSEYINIFICNDELSYLEETK